MKFDGLVKSRKVLSFVIPAEAGIQFSQVITEDLDSGFHRSDCFYEFIKFWVVLPLNFRPKYRRTLNLTSGTSSCPSTFIIPCSVFDIFQISCCCLATYVASMKHWGSSAR